jgi:hypothetical protein
MPSWRGQGKFCFMLYDMLRSADLNCSSPFLNFSYPVTYSCTVRSSEFVPMHAVKTCEGSRGVVSPIFKLATRQTCMVSLPFRSIYPGNINASTFLIGDRWVPQSVWTYWRNLLLWSGIKPRIIPSLGQITNFKCPLTSLVHWHIYIEDCKTENSVLLIICSMWEGSQAVWYRAKWL